MSPVPEEGEHDAKPPEAYPIDNLDVPDVFIEANSTDSDDDDDGDDFQVIFLLVDIYMYIVIVTINFDTDNIMWNISTHAHMLIKIFIILFICILITFVLHI